MIFQSLEWAHLFWILPLFLIFIVFHDRRRERLMSSFSGGRGILRRLNLRRLARALCFFSLSAMILALMQPAWNPTPTKVERRGRDIVFLLDVSRSMLAEDIAPNRLERAKIAIKDVIDRFDSHRVGLVVFAGGTAVKCPLTFDHNFFRLALDDAHPESISRGGSNIGDAIRRASKEVFLGDDNRRGRDLILISDGADQESFPVEAAKQARERGIRIISLGLGDDKVGHPIPVERNGQRSFLEYNGERVLSQLVPTTLKDVAKASKGGHYLHVATGHINLDEVYDRLIEQEEAQVLETKEVLQYKSQFQFFLILALIGVFVEGVIHER
ncbi:MAG: VWA domain-containing protein [Planctomycetota bacterium]|nr:VWA domain-containing protein [Planctomycetota bacterium]